MRPNLGGGEVKKMKGDGEGGSEGAYENDYGKLNNDIKITSRKFVKESAAFGAAVAGIPYNLTNIVDILKEDGELVMYPIIYSSEYRLARQLPFKRLITIELWGCNWNCKWCPVKFFSSKNMTPIVIPIEQIIGLLLNFGDDRSSTMLAISGGEPLLQKEEVLKLIASLKTRTNYTVILATNGSFVEENLALW
ncbi:MAG: radical SAM protein [Euryarchaeota archaeon]|nr:radical SAM protein [Euryarchaeota archaeon]